MENTTITNPFEVLSKREKEVLDLMLQGAQVKDISASMELKSNTISHFNRRRLFNF
jgi:DNA-binding NarL/FixJ family response regulator